MVFASSYDQSRFLKAADLSGEKKFRIKSVTEEEIGIGKDKERKLVVWFTNDARGLVLNRVNNRTIRGAFGDACEGWTGKIIIVFPTMAEFRGEMKPALRVRIKKLRRRPRVVQSGAAAVPMKELRHDTQPCQTYHTSVQSCKATHGAHAADRAAAMVRVALDTKTGWQLAEAAVHGNTARAARQHK
jgi:hypothetical protein